MTRLKIDQGDDEAVDLAVKLPPAYTDPADLTACKVWFLVKENVSDPDELALITKTSDPAEGITVNGDPTTGLAVVTILPADTSDLDSDLLGRPLPYSVQVKDGSDKIITVARGYITISPDLIKATA